MAIRFSHVIRGICSVALAALLMAEMPGCDKPKSEATAQAPANSAPAQAPSSFWGGANEANAAEGKLGGLYIRQRMMTMAIGGRLTFSLARDFFYFFPDGHMLFGVPSDGVLKEHPGSADFAAFQGIAPELRGTYAVKDGNITLHPEKGNEWTEPFSVPKAGDDSVLQIGAPSIVGSVKAMPFKEGEKLDGTYQFNGTVGQGTAMTIFNVNTLTFHPDGTLGSDQLTGVNAQGIDTTVGNSGVTTHDQSASDGSYKFNGYTLETTIGGKAGKATTFRWAGDDKTAAPGMICIAGRVYSRQAPKK